MEPLQITAHIPGAIALPGGPVALDALLAWAQAMADGRAVLIDEYVRVDIPVALAPGGRFHLASFSVGEIEEYDRHWINRRFPIAEAQGLGSEKVRRLNIGTGPSKSYRLPLDVGYLVGGRLDWWCIGERAAIERALAHVTHVGKKRSVGNGEVTRWEVRPVDPWPGFPVVRDGKPLRPLPVDWPGLEDPETAYRVLGVVEGPYWQNERRELVAVP